MLTVLAACLTVSVASAQKLSGPELVQALQGGGYVLVIRNARSPEEVPPERSRSTANFAGERELDTYGQGQMSVLSYALRELRIPVDYRFSGPAYRSRQSALYLGGFGEAVTVPELAEDADPAWLRRRAAEAPSAGMNTLIVTHGSLIEKAFGRDARGIGTAEALIYRPAGDRAELVARLTVEDWAKLAVQ